MSERLARTLALCALAAAAWLGARLTIEHLERRLAIRAIDELRFIDFGPGPNTNIDAWFAATAPRAKLRWRADVERLFSDAVRVEVHVQSPGADTIRYAWHHALGDAAPRAIDGATEMLHARIAAWARNPTDPTGSE